MIQKKSGQLNPVLSAWSRPITTQSINTTANAFVANLDIFKDNALLYRLYLQIQTYFTGLYNVETVDDEFYEKQISFFKWLWGNGELFIMKLGKSYYFFEVLQKWTIGTDVVKVKIRLVRENENTDYDKSAKEYIAFNGVHGIYVSWSHEQMTSWFFWWPVLRELSILLKTAYTSALTDQKKFFKQFNHNNELIIQKEQEDLLDPNKPFISVYAKQPNTNINENSDGNSEIGQINKYASISKQGESVTNQIWRNIENHFRFYGNLAGFAVPQSLRESGKNGKETYGDYYNTIAIEKVTLTNLEIFARKAKRLWNVDFKFTKTTELKNMIDGGQEKNETNISDTKTE